MLELIGYAGMIAALSGYGLLSFVKNAFWGHFVSLTACFLEGYYVFQHQAMANVFLSIAWAILAIFGLRAWWKRKQAIAY